MNKKIIGLAGLVVMALLLFLIVGNDENSSTQVVEEADIKELVQDYSRGNIKNHTASIDSHQLMVTDDNEKELAYELPEEEFFVSIAPYVEETHPCAVHNLTGCQGEMVKEEFAVYMEDAEGNVILDQTLKTEDNGFIDLWLPRNQTYYVTFSQDGKTAEAELSTFEGDNTCITTIQLENI